MLQELQSRIYDAMKAKDSLLLLVLREMKTKIESAKKEGHNDNIDVLVKMAKMRTQAHLEFTKAGKIDLAEKELKELAIIEHYLPKLMTDEEILKELDLIIREKSVDNIKGMGIVIKEFKNKFPGQCGENVSKLTKKLLTK